MAELLSFWVDAQLERAANGRSIQFVTWTLRRIAALVVALAAVVVFVGLGFWQLDRHDQKRNLRVQVERAVAAEPVPIGPDQPFTRVVAVGRYDPALEGIVLRSRNGVSGYHVITPFLLDGGGAVLVDRGWVPITQDTAPVGAAAPPGGRVEIEGVLWPAERGSGSADVPGPIDRIDPETHSASVGGLLDTYLVLQRQVPPPGELPIPPELPSIGLGPHLGYAGQWFLFALVVVVGFPLWLRRQAQPTSSASSRSKTTDEGAKNR